MNFGLAHKLKASLLTLFTDRLLLYTFSSMQHPERHSAHHFQRVHAAWMRHSSLHGRIYGGSLEGVGRVSQTKQPASSTKKSVVSLKPQLFNLVHT